MLMRMPSRLISLAAASVLVILIGCEPPNNPPPATQQSSISAAAMPNTMPGGRERISLVAIPFTIEVPTGWAVQPGVISNQIILHGRTSSGEFDILLGTGPSITPAALPLLLKQSEKTTTDPHTKSEVTTHDGITIVKRIAPVVDPKGAMPTDPALIPMGWSVQCIVTSDAKADYSVYELTFNGLSQATFDKDEAMLQATIDTLRYAPAATQPAMR